MMEKNPKTSQKKVSKEVLEAVRCVVHEEIEPIAKQVKYLMAKDHDQKVIDGWLKKHPQHKHRAELTNTQWLNRELLKALVYALAIIGALVGYKLWP